MNKRTLLNYFIGDPEPKHQRGQDQHGYVHCLVWGNIYNKGLFFAKSDEHSVGIGGCGIGKAKTVPEARQMIFDYAKAALNRKKEEALDLVRRCDEALEKLGDDPANAERFVGEYKERD